MPVMPTADPWPSIRAVVKCEKAIRSRGALPRSVFKLDSYWMDLVRLLRVYRCFRDDDPASMSQLKQEMSANVFDMYIDHKRRALQRRGGQPRRSARH